MKNSVKSAAAFSAVAMSLLLSTSTTFAHATLETSVANLDSYFKAVVRVPHGCDGKATNKLVVEMPEGFYAVKPMSHHGFDMSVEKGAYETPITLHGNEQTEGVRKVTWEGGVVEDWAYDEFTLFGRIANVEAGDTIYFKATQYCGANDSVSWDQIPSAEDDHPANPAIALKIAGKSDDHGAHAHHDMAKAVTAGDIKIENAWTRATPNGAKSGGAFLTLTNAGTEEDRLVGATSNVASNIEVHEMSMNDGVMKMQELTDGLTIPAGESVELKPGGFHMMMMGLHNAIAQGEMVTITLEFEKAGKVDVMFPAAALGAPEMDHSNH